MHLLKANTVSVPPPHQHEEHGNTPDENDERPDKGFCQKVPQGVCAVAYDR